MRAIEQLKYRYARCLDLKQWDGFADTLTADVSASYGAQLSFTGRDPVVELHAFLARSGDHHGAPRAPPGDHDRRGRSERHLVPAGHRPRHRAPHVAARRGVDDDRYVRTDAGWRIARTGYTRSYESVENLPDSWRLTANRWTAA